MGWQSKRKESGCELICLASGIYPAGKTQGISKRDCCFNPLIYFL